MIFSSRRFLCRLRDFLFSVFVIYFVADTKGNDLESSQLRGSEAAKIDCAKKHFEAISTSDVVYDVVKTYQKLYDIVTK